ncbi:MAG TPA: dihydropteroate synthase [Capsulimonadaceae bacterium]|jgi:cobalamin-dependent methionine synthase I
MSIPGLTIIGERINPGYASSKVLIDNRDLAGIQQLAINQTKKGAQYLTLNVGELGLHEPDYVVEVTKAIQEVSPLPISFDYPNKLVQEFCLNTYDASKANGAKPIVNSVSELRWDMLDVLSIQPAKVVLMASERLEDGKPIKNVTAEEIASTANRMATRVLAGGYGLVADDLIIDVSLCPLATDTEGEIKRAIDAIRLIGADPAMKGVHMLVGLSNVGIMLPKEAADGSRLNVKVESAFLTMTVPYGLDMVLGTPGRDYKLLPEDDFVYQIFQETINADGYDALICLRQMYSK